MREWMSKKGVSWSGTKLYNMGVIIIMKKLAFSTDEEKVIAGLRMYKKQIDVVRFQRFQRHLNGF